MFKKIFAVLLCSVLFMSHLETAFVSNARMVPAERQRKSVEIQVDYDTVINTTHETITYATLNPVEIAAYYGIEDAKEVTVTIFTEEHQGQSTSRKTYSTEESDKIAIHSAVNRIDKTVGKSFTWTRTISNKYTQKMTSNKTIDVAAISSGVGFDVTESWEINLQAHAELMASQSVTVSTYLLYDRYSFDISYQPLFGKSKTIGYGNAYQAVGYCTIVS